MFWCLSVSVVLWGDGFSGGTDDCGSEDGVKGIAIAGSLVGYCPAWAFFGDDVSRAWTSEIGDGFVDLVEGVNKSPSVRIDYSRHVHLPIEHPERPGEIGNLAYLQAAFLLSTLQSRTCMD